MGTSSPGCRALPSGAATRVPESADGDGDVDERKAQPAVTTDRWVEVLTLQKLGVCRCRSTWTA
jgi:hypothetical protein